MTSKRSRRRHQGRARPAALSAARDRVTELVGRVEYLAGKNVCLGGLLEDERQKRAAQLGMSRESAMKATMAEHMSPDKMVEIAVNQITEALMHDLADTIVAELRNARGGRGPMQSIRDYIRLGYVNPVLGRELHKLMPRVELSAQCHPIEDFAVLRVSIPSMTFAFRL